MNIHDRDPLDATEARVLGVLIEKDLATPAQYPLSLNSLTAACNQKSNRAPVLSLSEPEVSACLERLQVKGLAGGVQGAGSRISRYRHNAREVLSLSEAGLAIIAELLLRGAQGPGDLRSRASRMRSIPTQGDLASELDALLARGLVARLEPLPGTRTHRFDQLLALRERRPRSSAERETESDSAAPSRSGAAPATITPVDKSALDAPGTSESTGKLSLEARVLELEREVLTLRAELTRLANSLGEEL